MGLSRPRKDTLWQPWQGCDLEFRLVGISSMADGKSRRVWVLALAGSEGANESAEGSEHNRGPTKIDTQHLLRNTVT